MRLRHRWLAAGAAWGLVAGVSVAVYVGGMTAGFFWIFVFGDDPWPEWTGGVTLAASLAAGLAAFGTTAVVAYLFGRSREGSAEEARYRRWAHLCLAGAVVAAAVLVGLEWAERQDTSRRRTAEEEARSYLARLQPVLHVRLSNAGGELRFATSASDPGSGRYALTITLDGDYSRGAPIWTKSDTVRLDPARRTVAEASVPVEQVRRDFVRRRVTRPDGAWAADVSVAARVGLTPLLPRALAGRVTAGRWRGLLSEPGAPAPVDTAAVRLELRNRPEDARGPGPGADRRDPAERGDRP